MSQGTRRLSLLRWAAPRHGWLRQVALIGLGLVAAGVVLVLALRPSADVRKHQRLERAQGYLAERQVAEAILELRGALRLDPAFVPALHALGRAYLAQGWYADAARELERAARLAPPSPAVASDLGRALVKLEGSADALAIAGRILAEKPGDAPSLYLHGSALLVQRRPREALQAFLAAAERRPSLAAAHRGLGQAHQALDESGAAIESYRNALALDPNDVPALIGLAWLLSEAQGNPNEALPLAAKARDLAPESAFTMDTLGWIRYRLGSLTEARRTLERAADRAPRSGRIQYHLGMVLSSSGLRVEAVLALRRAVRLDPSLGEREGVPDLIRQLGG